MKDDEHIFYPNIPLLCDLCIESICNNRGARIVTCSSFRPRGELDVKAHPYDNYPCKKCALCNLDQYAKGIMFCTSDEYCWKNNDWAMYMRRRT